LTRLVIEPISLGTWPTPVEPAPRLRERLGLGKLWFKRDDLSGLGGGGNKVRKPAQRRLPGVVRVTACCIN